ncbi:MAG: ImmA/IrrE family metallo-endopeptidase [Oscillospiraceae bacterium]|jgi:Zn-dependent peptidase ImmA (M78 family)|nr:ImmA/IrrE family metallo-endopeptidase [Oscillospiraceae bacterium]
MAKLPVEPYVAQVRDLFQGIDLENKLVDQDKLDQAVELILEANKIDDPPVNVNDLAKRLNFDVYFLNLPQNILGVMFDTKEPFEYHSQRAIVLGSQYDNLRNIGTAAHEFGHYFMQCNADTDYYDTRHIEADTISEMNANRFRDTLLLPDGIVKKFLRKRQWRKWDKILEEARETFFVPRHLIRPRFERILKRSIVDDVVFDGSGLDG